MLKTIDEIMYITDGNNPWGQGLGFKPTKYNMKGSGYLEDIDKKIKQLEPFVKRTGKGKELLSELFRIKYGTIKRMKGGTLPKGTFSRVANDINQQLEQLDENEDKEEISELLLQYEKLKEAKKGDKIKFDYSNEDEINNYFDTEIDKVNQDIVSHQQSLLDEEYLIKNLNNIRKHIKSNIEEENESKKMYEEDLEGKARRFYKKKFGERANRQFFEAIRNDSIDNKLEKMINVIDDPSYIMDINNLINKIASKGTSYGIAFEEIFSNPSSNEKKIIKQILNQVLENKKDYDKIIDNNKLFNNPNFVIDLSVEDKNNFVKLLLELKNYMSSQAKIKKWEGEKFKEQIEEYKKEYNNKKIELEEKLKKAIEDNDNENIKINKNKLINLRNLFDTKVNKNGTHLTDNKFSGAYGSTVPIYDSNRKIKKVEDYNFGVKTGKTYKIDNIKTKAIMLNDDSIINYDISKDSNNKLVRKQFIMDNLTGKPRINKFGKTTERIPNLHDFFMESSYPMKKKTIGGKQQIVRVIPPHKVKIIKL